MQAAAFEFSVFAYFLRWGGKSRRKMRYDGLEKEGKTGKCRNGIRFDGEGEMLLVAKILIF